MKILLQQKDLKQGTCFVDIDICKDDYEESVILFPDKYSGYEVLTYGTSNCHGFNNYNHDMLIFVMADEDLTDFYEHASVPHFCHIKNLYDVLMKYTKGTGKFKHALLNNTFDYTINDKIIGINCFFLYLRTMDDRYLEIIIPNVKNCPYVWINEANYKYELIFNDINEEYMDFYDYPLQIQKITKKTFQNDLNRTWMYVNSGSKIQHHFGINFLNENGEINFMIYDLGGKTNYIMEKIFNFSLNYDLQADFYKDKTQSCYKNFIKRL